MNGPCVSIIIPFYNQAKYLPDCLENIKKLVKNISYEILLINDGSTDESECIVQKVKKWNRHIRYFYQKNEGVSSARNVGIKNARGKYLFFLDVDDECTPDTLKNCVEFFDKVYDEIDLLTFPIQTLYKGKVLEPHFRYTFLKNDGVYDLDTNAFIGQTTMNIMVKNRFKDNILFDETMSFSEDQKYCCDVLSRTRKMGFCNAGKYIYHRSDESSSGKLSGACFVYEQCMKMFEDIFSRYEYVPMAFQGLYVNDLYWKLECNMLFPYHYGEKDYERSILRIKKLLQKCYNSVILDHPTIDFFEKYYLMKLKGEDCLYPQMDSEYIRLYSEGNLVLEQKDIELVVTKLTVSKDCRVRIQGFLKSVFFQFYKGDVRFYAVDKKKRTELKLFPSTHDYYLSHEPTQNFWRCIFEVEADRNPYDFHFEVDFEGQTFPVTYYFMPLVPMSHKLGIYHYENHGVAVDINKNNEITVTATSTSDEKRIWLYYDCSGVPCDNGLLQFVHDYKKCDGVERYYILSDYRQKNYIPEDSNIISFGSDEHKNLIIRAEKIITAFIEDNNILPFKKEEYEQNSNKFGFETIYLQHGVLHIDMPWKYSPERTMADKIVVSAKHEAELFEKNGYDEDSLWKVGMPRFDDLPKTSNKLKKILYAPSWRTYLVGTNEDGEWELLENKFLNSSYYKGLETFLYNDELTQLLKEWGYELDVKLHPIFSGYVHLISNKKNEHINVVTSVQETEYSLFITDFSSYMFDFIKMGIPVLSFIPDYNEVKCGMNGYRKIDFLDKVDEAQVAKNAITIVEQIKQYFVTGRGMNYQVEFYNMDISSKDKIYDMMIHS